MSKSLQIGLQRWILATITITAAINTNSGVTALPQSTGNVPGGNDNNDDLNGDNSVFLQINRNPLRLPLDIGKQTMLPRGVDDPNAAIDIINYFFGEVPIMVHQAKILQAPARYGCFFWTPEDTAATISFPASGPSKVSSPLSSASYPSSSTMSSSSASPLPPGASSTVKFVSETFYSDSVGITIDNPFLDASFLTCFPTAHMQGPILDPDLASESGSASASDTGPEQDTYETVAIFLDILSPMDPNREMNPLTGNVENLQAPFVPIRLEPVQARASTDNTNSNPEASSTDGIVDSDISGDEEREEKAKRTLKVGYSSFAPTSAVVRAAIVHASNPDIRCRVSGQGKDAIDTTVVFSAKKPLQQPVFRTSFVMCFI